MYIELHDMHNKEVNFFDLCAISNFVLKKHEYGDEFYQLFIDNDVKISVRNGKEQLKNLYKQLRGYVLADGDDLAIEANQYIRIVLCLDGEIETTIRNYDERTELGLI